MKTITKVLIGFVGLITLIPLRLGISSWFAQSNLCEFFEFKSSTPDLEKLFVLTGGFILMLAAFQILTIIWLVKGKKEAFLMASIVGYTSVFRGIVTYLILGGETTNNIIISAAPIVVGTAIAILASIACKKENLTN